MSTNNNPINPNSDAQQAYLAELANAFANIQTVTSQNGTVIAANQAALDSGIAIGQAAPPTDVVLTPDGVVDVTPTNTLANLAPTGQQTVSVTQQAIQAQEATPLSEPTAVVVPANSSVIPTGPQLEGTPPEISPSEDPFEAARLQAIQDEANQDSPNEQTVINAEEDPFEKARMQANQEEDTSPNEQTVVDASTDDELRAKGLRELAAEQESNRAALKAEETNAASKSRSISGSVDQARSKAAVAVQRNAIQKDDWRLRLSLAPSSNYLYNVAKQGDLLYPLAATDGVIFPYTPQVNMVYRANYDPSDVAHSNYKSFYYKNSAVDDITITADFTAQDTKEADYLLAVIHFFKSVTKMFYGQDGKGGGPKAGTPPPLCYLNGFGQYQFSEHPVLISSFTYNLPNDVDYIRAGSTTQMAGTNLASYQTPKKAASGFNLMSLLRLSSNNLKEGGTSAEPKFQSLANSEATYVPTKIQFTISLLPVVTRNDISKNFSLRDYATGKLTNGRKRNGGGIW